MKFYKKFEFYKKFKLNYKLILVIIILIIALIFNFLNYKEYFNSNNNKLYFSEDLEKFNLNTDNCYSNFFKQFVDDNGIYFYHKNKHLINKLKNDENFKKSYENNYNKVKRSKNPIFCNKVFYDNNDFQGCCIAYAPYTKSGWTEKEIKDYEKYRLKVDEVMKGVNDNNINDPKIKKLPYDVLVADETCRHPTNLALAFSLKEDDYKNNYKSTYLTKLCHKNPIPKENEDSSYFLRLF